jgi:hypothetical protein
VTDRIEVTRTGEGLWEVKAWGGYDGFVREIDVPTDKLSEVIMRFAQYDGVRG